MTYSMWLILWVAVTVGAAVLLVWRILVAKQEFIRLSPEDSRVTEAETQLDGKLKQIDFWGKTLTAVSAAMVVVAIMVSLYHVLANGRPH